MKIYFLLKISFIAVFILLTGCSTPKFDRPVMTAMTFAGPPPEPPTIAVTLINRTPSSNAFTPATDTGYETSYETDYSNEGFRSLGLVSEPVEGGTLYTFEEVLFDTASAVLRADAMDEIQEFSNVMFENPYHKASIEGHADSRGGDIYNQKLSESRAYSVKNALVAQGVEASRLIIRGYGEDQPVASNHTPTGRQQNRRVEIFLMTPID